MIRVRVLPGQVVVDKLDDEPPHGHQDLDLLVLTGHEIDDAIAALTAAKTAPARAYVVAQRGKVTVDP